MKIISYSEVLMRLNPKLYYRLEQSSSLDFSFTGTGVNFLTGLNLHGIETKLLTSLPDNRIGQLAKKSLQFLDIDTSLIKYNGSHIGLYIIELGHDVRPSQVTYLDREHSSFNQALLSSEEIGLALKGVDMIHLCGIALSTSPASLKNLLNIVDYSYANDIKVIFDFNFRPSLNANKSEADLLKDYERILKKSSIVFGSVRDISRFQDCDNDEELMSFVRKYELDYFCGTEKSSDKEGKFIQGFIYTKDKVVRSEKLKVDTLDRIGTGDAFASAVLAKIIKEMNLEDAVHYATVASQLSYTTMGDTPLLDEAFIMSHINDPKEVIR